MPRFIVGDRVRVGYSTPELGSKTGTIIDISYVSNIRKLDDPMDDPRVYVLRLEDGSVRRFTSDEIYDTSHSCSNSGRNIQHTVARHR